MTYKLTKKENVPVKEKYGMSISVYPDTDNQGHVLVETETGYNQEFSNTVSTHTYVVLEGEGSFFLNDDEVRGSKGDIITIEPNTRIYYKGKLKMFLTTSPAWSEADEVETKARIW